MLGVILSNIQTMITPKSHILIIDDDNRILKLLKKFLQQNDFLVSAALSAKEAFALFKNFTFDLVILDVMMPEMTGIEFAKEIRKNQEIMPIIMLTALSEPEDRVKGLEAGARDYMTKPFEPRELLLRINNLIDLHKIYKNGQDTIRIGGCIYNLTTRSLSDSNGKDIPLGSTQQKLLDILIESKSQVMTRDELSVRMGGLNPRSIDVQIVRLRSKLEPDLKNPKHLKTIRNLGYVLYIQE